MNFLKKNYKKILVLLLAIAGIFFIASFISSYNMANATCIGGGCGPSAGGENHDVDHNQTQTDSDWVEWTYDINLLPPGFVNEHGKNTDFKKTVMRSQAYSDALTKCQIRQTNPSSCQLALIGYINTPKGATKQAGLRINSISGNIAGHVWNFNGYNYNINSKWTNGSSIADAAAEKFGNTLIVVFASPDDFGSGWLPTFNTVNFDAYTSRVRVDSHELEPCPYEYTMQVSGIDGYVKGYDTKQERYKTSYGKFWDSIATGQHKQTSQFNYNNGNAINNGAYSGAYLDGSQDEKNQELLDEYERTCDDAKAQHDNYNIESETATNQAGDSISGKEFIDKYAKGGVYKVIRGERDAIINYKTTDIEYYKASGAYDVPAGWEKCTDRNQTRTTPNGRIVHCSDHWNQNRPGNEYPAMMNIRLTSGWTKLGSILDAEAAWNAATSGCDYTKNTCPSGNAYRNNTPLFLYDSGYRDMNGNWIPKNKVVAKTKSEWLNNFDSFINYGFPGPDINNQIRPVKQELQSWKHLWHQDFMNILCDKTDFDAYKAVLDKMYGDYIYTDISKVANGSKYQGQLKSPIIDSQFAFDHNKAEVDATATRLQTGYTQPQSNTGNYEYKVPDFTGTAESLVAATMEPFDRVLYTVSTPVGSDNKLDMANAFTNIKSVVGDTSADTLLNNKAKSVNSAYNTDNFIRWYYSAAYDASLDPVYTKECPYDCTSNSKGYAGGAQYNIVDGSTSDGASDNAYLLKRNVGEGSTSDYGVRVRTTDSKGNLKPSTEDVNTANMTFFRNNAWSRFRVDLWYPVLDNGLTEAKPTDSIAGISETKGSQTAKSTTIIRNNGTPWYVKGTDSSSGFATEMKAIKSIDDGDSIDGSNARLFNETTDIIPGNQISLGSVTAHGAHVVELPYEATAFAIRSMWATDPNIGKLEFNIKWEFDTKNNLDVPTKFTVGNTADSVSSTSTPQYAISDGKCYARNSYNERIDEKNLINLFHDNTGAGTIDNLDKEFSDNFGKFTIQFVRATAE